MSDFSAYATAALRESSIGAVSGAIFGPMGAFATLGGKMAIGGISNAAESVIRQSLEGEGINFQTVLMDAGIGIVTAGIINSVVGKTISKYAGKAIDQVAPWMRTGFKAMTEKFGDYVTKLSQLGSTLGKKYAGAQQEWIKRTTQEVKEQLAELGRTLNLKNYDWVSSPDGRLYLVRKDQVLGGGGGNSRNPKPSNASERTGEGSRGIGAKQPVQIIQNRYPNEIQQGKTFEYVLENGQVKIRDGIKEVDFIIDVNGNLKVGRGHSYLANGADVQAAGKLKVDANGNVRKITNESGHYTPTAVQVKNYEQIFNNSGIKTKNAWLEVYQLELTSNGYVDLGKLKKTTSTKLK